MRIESTSISDTGVKFVRVFGHVRESESGKSKPLA